MQLGLGLGLFWALELKKETPV
jgi:hypothetical protein